ncbi:MAG TPA: D-arabinono-1,4-lactone oxidase [Rhizomicrobium sp.]|nr:D-arabinono-1,4-lactone oxidase [Rhizomicrobium sp.]
MSVNRRNVLIGSGVGAAVVVGAGALGYERAVSDKPEPPAPPATNAKGDLVWRNWSGIQHSYPELRVAPKSEDELANVLRAAQAPIRAVGAGHSFMPLVPTDGTLMTLDNIAGVTDVDANGIATMWVGTRLGDLGPALAAKGRAMANLPDINKQSLGGALGTATHGTGKHLRAIHGDVVALRLATARGELVECSADNNPDLFNAARVSMGSLGIITQAKLKTIPNRRLHRRVWLEDFDETVSKAEERWKTHRNYEFYAIPFTGLAANITHDETDEPARPRGPDTDTGFLEMLKAVRNLLGFSTGMRKTTAKLLLETFGTPEEAVDEGWKLLSTERPVRFNEMEFHMPAGAQLSALKEVVATIEKYRPDVFFPIETRRIATDDAWLSPFQGGEHGSVAVHAYYKDDYDFFFTMIQPIFRRHGGRPHWGKLNSLTTKDFASLYPRWNDFVSLRRQMDPEGRLMNSYLKGIMA